MKNLNVILTAVVCMLLTLPVSAAEGEIMDDVIESVEEGFTELERKIIKRYYRERHGHDIDAEEDDEGGKSKKHHKKSKSKEGLPPGLAKKDRLPPGLEKQLEKNGTLPPGLAKRDLPDDLEDRLGKPPKGYERTIVDNDVVLIEAATRKVVDIITDAVLD